MKTIIHPIKYRIIERKITPEKSYWHFIKGKTFYNPLNLPSEGDIEFMFGTTKKKVVIELFRINGGKVGYYLVDLREKQYYYCGQKWEDVKAKLRELGIGTNEPNYHS
ncbi:hypothetical protein [Nostoc sp. JL33]|nr:hypothetical protein [Nostoc sp. JL33]MBN3872660.1 hypothetical protein [Nostoc sp. JL33]